MSGPGPLTWPLALAVATGGGAGALLRHVLGRAVQGAAGGIFPWGTFCVNAGGCLVFGVAAAWLAVRDSSPLAGALLLTGVLGGFTTFSTFSAETVTLARQGRPGLAAAYVAASLVTCLAATAAGGLLGSAVSRSA